MDIAAVRSMGRTARRSFEKWGMTMSERNPYEFEKIPDFAMQPAREDAGGFDPELYERLLAGLVELEPEEEALSVEAALQTDPAVETVLQIEPIVQPAATAPPDSQRASALHSPPVPPSVHCHETDGNILFLRQLPEISAQLLHGTSASSYCMVPSRWLSEPAAHPPAH